MATKMAHRLITRKMFFSFDPNRLKFAGIQDRQNLNTVQSDFSIQRYLLLCSKTFSHIPMKGEMLSLSFQLYLNENLTKLAYKKDIPKIEPNPANQDPHYFHPNYKSILIQ